jgi:hypothetical protein
MDISDPGGLSGGRGDNGNDDHRGGAGRDEIPGNHVVQAAK